MTHFQRMTRLIQLGVPSLLVVSVALIGCKTTQSSGKSNSSGEHTMKAPPPERPVERPRERPRAAAKTFDHQALTTLLKKYVDGKGRVAYAKWLKDAADVKALVDYRKRLAAFDPTTLSRDGQKAFWLNAYNAHVLHGVMAALPANPRFSVSDKGFVFFDQAVYPTAGQTLTLNEIENGILRGDWGHKSLKKTPAGRLQRIRAFNAGVGKVDPRIHFALVCASEGCPNLQQRAYTGAQLEAQLESDTKAYLNNPTKGAGPKGVTALFNWFKKDFVSAGLPPKKFVAKYYQSDLSKVRFDKEIKYSWKLNKQ